MKTRIECLVVLFLFGLGLSFAAEGRKELFEPVDLSCASAGGRYFLSRDITAPAGVALRFFW